MQSGETEDTEPSAEVDSHCATVSSKYYHGTTEAKPPSKDGTQDSRV